MKTAIVDLQGFKTDYNEFIVKELAILCENQTLVLLIKPPYPFYELSKTEKMQVQWIERNRKIYWHEGFTPFLNFKQYVADYLKDKIIYVKGFEKVVWLKNIVQDGNIINLDDSPSLRKLYENYSMSKDIFSCVYHTHICALKNVMCLKKWMYEVNNNIFFE